MMIEQTILRWCLSVEERLVLMHPETLIEGEHYIYQDYQHGEEPAISVVKFVGYTSCPAIVVVSDSSGKKTRYPRDGLFQLTLENPFGNRRSE